MILRYTERAIDDVELAFVWYEKQRRGLGFEFLDCVEIAVRSILDNPEMYRIYYSFFRRCVIRRFPYSVFYTVAALGFRYGRAQPDDREMWHM